MNHIWSAFRRLAPTVVLLAALVPAGLACDSGGPVVVNTPIPGSSNTGATDNNPPPAAPRAQVITISPVPQQATTKIGTWTIQIVEDNVYQDLPDPKGGTLRPKNAFIIVRMKVTNGGTAAAHLATTDYQLVDSAGHTYAPDATAIASFAGSKKGYAPPDTAVPAGASADLAVGFDAPPDLPGPTLVIQGTRIKLGQ